MFPLGLVGKEGVQLQLLNVATKSILGLAQETAQQRVTISAHVGLVLGEQRRDDRAPMARGSKNSQRKQQDEAAIPVANVFENLLGGLASEGREAEDDLEENAAERPPVNLLRVTNAKMKIEMRGKAKGYQKAKENQTDPPPSSRPEVTSGDM